MPKRETTKELGRMCWRARNRVHDFDPDSVIVIVHGGGRVRLGDYLRADRPGSVESYYARLNGLTDPDPRPDAVQVATIDFDRVVLLTRSGARVLVGEFHRWRDSLSKIEKCYATTDSFPGTSCEEPDQSAKLEDIDPLDHEVLVAGAEGERSWVPLRELKARRGRFGDSDRDHEVLAMGPRGQLSLTPLRDLKASGAAAVDPMDHEVLVPDENGEPSWIQLRDLKARRHASRAHQAPAMDPMDHEVLVTDALGERSWVPLRSLPGRRGR